MGEVIQFQKVADVRGVSTEELKAAWESWGGDPCEKVAGFDFETVFFELNRRGEGKHCAV